MRVVFHYAAGPELAARLAALEGLEVEVCPEADDGRFAALVAEAEVLWHVLKPVTAAVVAAAPRLRLIQKIGVGVNTIDLDAARARDVAVCNLPGTNAPAVAELTLLLMPAALRQVAASTRRCVRGRAGHRTQECKTAKASWVGGQWAWSAMAQCRAPLPRC